MTRVAVVGAGYFGQFHVDAWARMADVELVGIVERDPDRGAEIAAAHGNPPLFANIDALLAEAAPELIDITAPPSAHLDLIREAAGGCRWIICQKPFCGDLETAQQAVAMARERGFRLAVHENVRFQPWYREIARLLAGGATGDPYQVTFRLRPGDGQGADAYLARQPYFQQMERFLVHETAIHWIDTFRFLLGEMTSVSADLVRLNPAIAGEDAGILQCRFECGARGLLDCNRLADHAAENRRLTMGELDIEGSGGTIRLDGDGAITIRTHGSNVWTPHSYDWRNHLFGGDCVHATCAAILEAFRAGEPAETDADAYLRNMEIEMAVYRSHDERCWIDV